MPQSRPGPLLGEDIPSPPRDPVRLAGWVKTWGVEAFASLTAVGSPEAPLPRHRFSGGRDVPLSFLELLLQQSGTLGGMGKLLQDAALERLSQAALARATLDEARRHFEQATPPADPVLAGFTDWLLAAHRRLPPDTRVPGRHAPVGVHVEAAAEPHLVYREDDLYAPTMDGTVKCHLRLIGWETDVPHLSVSQGHKHDQEAHPGLQRAALEAFVRFVCGEGSQDALEGLRHVLVTPGWSYLLQRLDGELDDLPEPDPEGEERRIGFRVTGQAPQLKVQPVLQKRQRGGGLSVGARIDWREAAAMEDVLTPEDLQVIRAHFDPVGRPPYGTGPHDLRATFACLLAMRDHPRTFWDLPGHPALEVATASVAVRFVEDAAHNLSSTFELGPLSLSASALLRFTPDRRHVIAVGAEEPHRIVLATLTPQTAALVKAFANTDVRLAPEAKEDLLARLQPLQGQVDLSLPASWIGELRPARFEPVVRVEPQQSGALDVTLLVRPLPRGPTWRPGQGPAVVLGGVYQQRHSVRRDFAQEELAAAALATRLGLDAPEDDTPFSYRVAAGDAAFDWLTQLQELQSAEDNPLQVEWPREGPLVAGGSVGRAQLKLRVNTQRDWFGVQGEALAADGTTIRLAELLAAAREGRRYVVVAGRTFYRLAEELRQLLELAEAERTDARGDLLQLGRAQAARVLSLLDHPEQIEADAAFARFRRRLDESEDIEPQVGPALTAALRPYQWEGVRFLARLAHWGAGAVLADEMGLGKTLQALALLEHRAPEGPALVIAPTSVNANWLAEAARFAPALRVQAYREAGRRELLAALGPGDVLVTSYAIAVLDAGALSEVPFASLILDEAQAIKNASTERARAVRSLAADWKLALTGTPLENRVSELWSLFHTVSPGLLGSWQRFRAVFAVPIERYGDLERRRRLAEIIRPYVLRRRKAEVAQELPPRTEVVRKVSLGPTERRAYETLRTSALANIDKQQRKANEKKNGEPKAQDVRMLLLAALTRLRQLSCHPRLVQPDAGPSSAKLETLLRLAGDLQENGSRALIFSQFRSLLDIVEPHLRAAGYDTLRLDGTTAAPDRAARVERFQAGEAQFFLISLKAGGVGLNLTAADVVIHLDPWWNPAVEDQASDRAHRIGQTRPVTVIRLIAEDTVEEAVLALHADKRALVDGVLEGTGVAGALSVDELVGLIKGRTPA